MAKLTKRGLRMEKDDQGGVALRSEYQVRLGIEKKKDEPGYRRWMECDNTIDAYNAVAVLIRDMAEAMDQPLDHVVAVIATVLLAPKGMNS